MECEQCGKEFSGRSDAIYCSPSCRAVASRNRAMRETAKADAVEVLCATAISATSRSATLQDYYDNPEDYAPRTAPELLNWGPYMTAEELNKSGLKGNRVPIPGDFDYTGVWNDKHDVNDGKS